MPLGNRPSHHQQPHQQTVISGASSYAAAVRFAPPLLPTPRSNPVTLNQRLHADPLPSPLQPATVDANTLTSLLRVMSQICNSLLLPGSSQVLPVIQSSTHFPNQLTNYDQQP